MANAWTHPNRITYEPSHPRRDAGGSMRALMARTVARAGSRAGTLGSPMLFCDMDTIMVPDEHWTPLARAAFCGSLKQVERLIGEGACVDALTRQNGHSVLQIAACHGHVAVVETLLRHGADVSWLDGLATTALAYAAARGHVGVVLRLLREGPWIDAYDGDDWTSLHLAAHAGHLEVMRVLVEHGANLEATARFGRTPLATAAAADQWAGVELLLELGARLEPPQGVGPSALCVAAHAGHAGLVRVLLDLGADPNYRGEEGRTALHESLTGEDDRVVSPQDLADLALVLLASGADPNVGDQLGWTPLMEAAMRGQGATFDVLLAGGADARQVDASSWTTLMFAAYGGHAFLIRRLLAEGVNPNVVLGRARAPGCAPSRRRTSEARRLTYRASHHGARRDCQMSRAAAR